MCNTGTFKPFCKRGHSRLNNTEKSGCLTCADMRRKGLIPKSTIPSSTGTFKPFCKRGHKREGNVDKGSGCLSCQVIHRENEMFAFKNNPDRQMRHKNKSWMDYGIKNSDGSNFQVNDYNRIFQIQGGKCAVCEDHQSQFKKSLIADHSHTTGIFRGLLCQKCNLAIGLGKDDYVAFESLSRYLDAYSERIKINQNNLQSVCVNGHKYDKTGKCVICFVEFTPQERLRFNHSKFHQIRNDEGSLLSLKDYNRAFQIQSGRCLGCSKHQSELKQSLCVDHDHVTRKFRGLLCSNCNCALGLAKDNMKILKSLATYLKGRH